LNLWLWLLALIFWWEQNQYFGWNWQPKSDAELIADGLTVLLFALSILGKRA
jgi:hypothetical protein